MTAGHDRREESAYREARREELLQVAASLIAANGFAGTTVRDIGEASGLLSGSLYYYFRSKEAIVEALMDRLLAFLWERYDAVRSSDAGPRDKLEGVVRSSLAAIDQYRDEVRIFQNEGQLLERRFSDMAARDREFKTMVTGFLEEGVARGEFRSDLRVEVSFRIIRDSMWPIVHWYRPGGGLTIEEVAEDYLSMLLRGIAAEPGQTP